MDRLIEPYITEQMLNDYIAAEQLSDMWAIITLAVFALIFFIFSFLCYRMYKERGGDWCVGSCMLLFVGLVISAFILLPVSNIIERTEYPDPIKAEFVHKLERNVVITNK